MPTSPDLSIVVPNYNHALHLPTAISSILKQDYSNFELILIEDASTDNSREVIAPFCAQDARINLIEHKQNRGVYYSMNEGLEAARGRYIHFLGADDFYMPGFLSATLRPLVENPLIGIAACDSNFFYNSPTSFTPLPFAPKIKEPVLLAPREVAFMLQKTLLKFSGSNSVVKTHLLRELGGFDEKFLASCDWIVLTKIALTHGAYYIPKPLITWKKNLGGISCGVLGNRELRRKMYGEVLEEISTFPPSLFKQFKLSGELGCVLKFSPWELIKRPSYWSFIPIILKRFLLRQWQRRVRGLMRQKSENKA